jgi:hypothetical protein
MRIEKDDYSAILYCDGSMRIEPKEKIVCFDLTDLKELLMAAEQYKHAECTPEDQLAEMLTSESKDSQFQFPFN